MESLLSDVGIAPAPASTTAIATADPIEIADELVDDDVILYADPATLLDSPFQPRTTYNEAKLREGAETMMPPNGRMLQPIVVRDVSEAARPLFVGVDTLITYELVFGHRRKRMALMAGLRRVPIIVRKMTDEQVKLAQIIENLQRDDVHAIDEAEGIDKLMLEHSKSVEEVMAETGKSKSYVYGRLKLLKAIPAVREACLRGDFGSEILLLIARLDHEQLQLQALNAFKQHDVDVSDGGQASLREARELLKRLFTLDTKSAMFKPDDAMLLIGAGACTACPKLSGNDPVYLDLTLDHKHKHWTERGCTTLCTDIVCWDNKAQAHLALEANRLRTYGKTVIDGDKAKAALKDSGRTISGTTFIPLDDARALLKKIANKKDATGKPLAESATVLIQNQKSGVLVEAVDVSLLKKAGVSVPKKEKPKPSWQLFNERMAKERAQAEERGAASTSFNRIILARVRAAAADRERDLADVDMIARAMLHFVGDDEQGELLAELWGRESFKQLLDGVQGMSTRDIAALMLDVALTVNVVANGHRAQDKPEALLATAKRYGVSLDPNEPAFTPPPAAQAQAVQRAADADASDELGEDLSDDLATAAGTASTPSPAARAQANKPPTKYRDPATLETWSGRGLQPKWLKVAIANGKKLSDFEVSQAASGRKDVKGAGVAGVSSSSTPAVAGGDGAKGGVA